MTMWKLGIACGVGTALMLGASSALALGPVNIGASSASAGVLSEVSFFGRPYPYGYTGWGPCVRYVEVETPLGPRVRRVRVCR